MPGIPVSDVLYAIKPEIMGWINDGIAGAVLNGVTINTPSNLPLNLAYINVEQSFVNRQWIVPAPVSSTSGIYNGLSTDVQVDPSGASDAQNVSINATIYTAVGNNKDISSAGRVVAIQGIAAHYGDGALNGTNRGILAQWALRSGATVGEASAVIAQLSLDNSSGGTLTTGSGLVARTEVTVASTLTNGQGIYIENPTVSGGGAITSFAGILVDAITTPTNHTHLLLGTASIPSGNFNIYSPSTLDNYLAGGLQLGSYSSSRTAKLYAFQTATTTAASSYFDIWSDQSIQPASNSAAFFRGGVFTSDVPSSVSVNLTGNMASVEGLATFAGTGTAANILGGIFTHKNTGAGTVTLGRGLVVESYNTSNGTLTNAAGIDISIVNTGSGTITNGAGLRVYGFTNSGGGTLTSAAGISIQDVAAGTNKTNLLLGTLTIPSGTYNIYAASTLANYFGGNITIDKEIIHKQIAKPSAPASGYNSVYTKTDNHWYIESSNANEKELDARGYAPFCFPIGLPTGTGQTVATLAVVSGGNGGSIAIPFMLSSHMLLQSYSYWNRDTSGAHTLEARLYEDRFDDNNSLDFITGSDATWSFTPSAADRRTSGAVSGAPVYLAPGLYWLVIRNTSASVTAAVGGSSNAGTIDVCQTKSIASLGSTLDFVAATWTKVNANSPLVTLNGRVFGQSTAW